MIAAIALPSVAILSCNSIARESAPVQLVVSGTQNLNQIDLQAGRRRLRHVAAEPSS